MNKTIGKLPESVTENSIDLTSEVIENTVQVKVEKIGYVYKMIIDDAGKMNCIRVYENGQQPETGIVTSDGKFSFSYLDPNKYENKTETINLDGIAITKP